MCLFIFIDIYSQIYSICLDNKWYNYIYYVFIHVFIEISVFIGIYCGLYFELGGRYLFQLYFYCIYWTYIYLFINIFIIIYWIGSTFLLFNTCTIKFIEGKILFWRKGMLYWENNAYMYWVKEQLWLVAEAACAASVYLISVLLWKQLSKWLQLRVEHTS